MSATPESLPHSASAPEPIRIKASRVTERQLAMINNPARFLFVGAGTKTGKSTALELRAARSVLRGEPVAWCGSGLKKTNKSYRRIKQILERPIEAGALVVNDSTGSIYNDRGDPLFVSFTGEHPEAIYGDAYKLFIIDEASRQPQAVYDAALTTISATNGQIVCAFNLDHGARNWAVKMLLEVKDRLSPQERIERSRDFMTFPTLAEPWVDPQVVEEIRTSGIPKVLFDALYNAIIPSDDVSLFAHLDQIFTGPAPQAPLRDHTYIMGVDLGRKRNWTVASVFDVTIRRFCATIRLYKIGWTMQYERTAELYNFWRCSKAWVDQSGLGDPVVEELEERGMSVEGYVFSEPSRKVLCELGSAQCDGKRFTAPDTEDFAPHKAELASFEIVVSKDAQGKIMYKVPEGSHDDAAFSVMLALYGAEQGNFGSPRIESLRSTKTRDGDWGDDDDDDRIVPLSRRDLSGY